MTKLLDEVLEAHGGLERWRAVGEIRARVRSGGLLLATRAPSELVADYRLTIRLDEPWARIEPAGRSERAIFDAGAVRLEDASGAVIESRDDPRPFFFGRSGLRRNFRWDPLDLAYFAGYAMWNYMTTPLLLTRDEVEVREGAAWTAPDGETWRPLEARFDPALDTHSPEQTFWIGPDGLICRHDYTADVVGAWAKAAHALAKHREFGGLIFPTSRRVTPRGVANRALPYPALVWLELSEIEVDAG
ncbi:MAG: hypothetical protein ACR2OC_11120 [Solirubrobacterales bacterium]